MKRFLVAAAVLLVQGGLSRAAEEPTKLAEGVWAMRTTGGSNAGWFTFGDTVVAVDSGRTPEEAELLLSAISETTGKKVPSMLVLTNNFGPHAGGAPVFARRGATVVCQENVGPGIFGLVQGALAAAGSAQGKLAVMSVASRIVLSDAGRHVEISYPGPADSAGDLIVYLADQQILFSGDLVETAILPPLFSRSIDPEGWIKALDSLQKLKLKMLVPGYGPIGPVDGLEATRAYLGEAWDLAKKIAQEPTPDSFLETRVTQPDARIKGLPEGLEKSHEKNLLALVRVIRSKSVPAKK